jgi:hypothetical protein
VLTIPISEILADSLPFGRYWVVADLALDNVEIRPFQTYHTAIPIGVVVFGAEPDPMPQSRTINGLRYTASSRIIHGDAQNGDTVRTLVLVTNTREVPVSLGIPRECPVIVSWYRSTADRDSLPSLEPLWREGKGCPWHYRNFVLAPRQSVTLHSDKPMREIPASAGTGRYYLLAWTTGIPSAMVSAGVIDVP